MAAPNNSNAFEINPPQSMFSTIPTKASHIPLPNALQSIFSTNSRAKSRSDEAASLIALAVVLITPIQSMLLRNSAIFLPNSPQLVFSKSDIIVFKSPFTKSPSLAPLSAQSKSDIAVFMPFESCKPKLDQSKVLAASPIVSKSALHLEEIKCPIPSQFIVLTTLFSPFPIKVPIESQFVLSKNEFAPATPVLIVSPIVCPIESDNPLTSASPFINSAIDFPT